MSEEFAVKKALRMFKRNRLPPRRVTWLYYAFPKYKEGFGNNFKRTLNLDVRFKKVWFSGRECGYSMRDL